MKRIIICIIILLSFTTIVVFNKKQNNNFSSTQWINNENKSKRIDMINDLEKKHSILGMESQEIEELLGKPDWTFDSSQTVYEDFKNMQADEYWGYRVKNDMFAGWKIYLLGFNNGVVVGKKITLEDW